MKKIMIISVFFFIACVVAISQYMSVERFQPIEGCESNDELKVVCGFTNPEDLALTPDDKFFILSEYGGQKPIQEVLPGQISLFHIPTRTKREFKISFDKNTWGDKFCTRQEGEVMAPHGLDLLERNDGKLQLAVVSHLPNERVEMFEIIKDGDGWSGVWRGCVSTHEKYYLNDVSLKKARNKLLESYENFSFTKDMLENQEALDNAITSFKPEVIIHLAAQAGVRYSIENPRAYLSSNISGTFNVIESAHKVKVNHLFNLL